MGLEARPAKHGQRCGHGAPLMAGGQRGGCASWAGAGYPR